MSSYTVYTGVDGSFAINCPDGTSFMDGSATLSDQVYVAGFGKDGAFAGAELTLRVYNGDYLDLRAANDYAAHIYKVLHENIPRAETKFGRSRPLIRVYVSDQDNYENKYIPGSSSTDHIRLEAGHVFASGIFQQDIGFESALHEYGHAFHYNAIEHWSSYFCTDSSTHHIEFPYTRSCAFVEGFADFFAATVGGYHLAQSELSDHTFEMDPDTIYDGLLVEANAASFLYDLVDGPDDPDRFDNTSDGVDDDAAEYPASYVANLIQSCSINGVAALDGIDQFIYCAEESLAAQSVAPSYSTEWRTSYTSVSAGTTHPPSWNASTVRTIWLRNLYGQ